MFDLHLYPLLSMVFLLTLGQELASDEVLRKACSTPAINLVSPYKVPGDGWLVHGSIAFAVDVQDITSISKVEFFVDDKSVYTDSDYPYGLLWNTRDLEPATYNLKAVATNDCGGCATVSQDVEVATPLVKDTASGSIVSDGLLPNIRPAIEGINLRDTTLTSGPDNTYYLSGTGSDNDAWHHNEGINLWSSTDLKTWSYMGLIWSFERDGTDDEKTWSTYKDTQFRAVWAPEFQYINNNYYITFSRATHGSKLLISTTGNPEGPYEVSGGEDRTLFNNIDGSLFTSATDARSGYLCYENGNIVKMNQGWNATTGDVTRVAQGDEGCFVFHWNGKYYLSVAKFMSTGGRYSSYVGIASYPTGPYSQFHEAIPCGGHNTYFVDRCGALWGTFFGNDDAAPWREQPAIVKMATNSDGTLYPDPDQSVEDC